MSVLESPNKSIAAASRDLGIPVSSVQRILRKHKMHPYSLIKLQSFHLGDDLQRLEFCKHLIIKCQEDSKLFDKIIWKMNLNLKETEQK